MKKVAQASVEDLSLEARRRNHLSHSSQHEAHQRCVVLAWQERNLLSVAYKNVVGARRASLRIIGSIQNKEEQKGDSEKVNLISAYKGKVPPPPPSHTATGGA